MVGTGEGEAQHGPVSGFEFREFECDLQPRFESAMCIEPVPPPYPRKSTQFMGPEGYFSRTDSTPNSSSSVCKSAAYFIDSQLMCTSEDIANWRRRTRQ